MKKFCVSLLFIGCAGLLGACAGTGDIDSSSQAAVSSSVESASSSSLANVEDCLAPPDMVLTDIVSVVRWINAMPKPLSLPCFVKSIPRPMYYNATISTFSAQPSIGRRSPRVFFQIDNLMLTVVPDETTDYVKNLETGQFDSVWDPDGIQLLEMAFKIPSDEGLAISIKGEIAFPVTTTLPDNAAYAHISFTENNTTCSVCHARERKEGELDGQPYYSSVMLRNDRSAEVLLAPMLNEYSTCDPTLGVSEAYRCSMLEAIYGQGMLVWKSFPLDIPTF